MVYQTHEEFWLIDEAGKPTFLIDRVFDGRISPDGSQIVYWYWQGDTGADDIWLAELPAGERRNLTHSPNRVDRYPEWWPAQPEVIIFGSQPEVTPGIGNLTTVQVDGTNYQVLDEQGGGYFALSPDGQRIAYSCCDGTVGGIYRWGNGYERFDPAAYGMTVEKMNGPAWSPDGHALAWQVSGKWRTEDDWQTGVAVFDLTKNTSTLLHLYEVIDGAEASHHLSWSPDGHWLAYVTWNEDVEAQKGNAKLGYMKPPAGGPYPNLWVISVDGQEEFHLGSGVEPVWSPDSQWLAYNRALSSPNNEIWLATVGTWEQHQILSTGYRVVQWLSSAK